MKPLLIYLLQVTIASAILYAYYHIAMRNKRFHQYNRFYLLTSVFISVLIPFLNIPVYFSESQTQSFVVLQTLESISYSPAPVIDVSTSPILTVAKEPFNWNIVLYTAYATIVFLLLLRILFSLKKIRSIIKNNTVEELDGVHFVNTMEPGTPYSFFRWLFWNKKIELRSDKGEHIFRHEIFHIQQRHSLDRIMMEILTVFFWINPFFHLIKKELKAIHEFLADQFAVHETKKWEYAELLLMQAFNTQQQLVNPFFHNQIKRRIAMITNPKKTSHRYLRKLLVLPVAAIVVTLFAFKYKSRNETKPVQANEPITVVIDAAHGGIDPGAKSVDRKYSEAQITLELARTIQKLASEYNVNVVMTREDDNLPGNASTIEEGLKRRVEISDFTKPSAYISLHVNATPVVKKVKNNSIEATVNKDVETGFPEGSNGFEAYVPAKNDPHSNKLASSVLQNVSALLTTKIQPLQRKHGIYVLERNKYPSIVLQCGYITNQSDLDFITKSGNQEKIARSILTGIVSFANGKEATKPDVTTVTDTVPDKMRVANIPVLADYAKALIVIDGKIKENLTIDKLGNVIKPDDIQLISVLKDQSATDKYGDKGKNGVIEIGTKQAYLKTKAAEQKETSLPDDDSKTFTNVEIEPAFPGGLTGWTKYLGRNLDPTVPEKNKATAGTYTVFVQFIVLKDGSISNVQALTNHGFGMEQEGVRVIKAGPKWLPAIQNGKTVNAYRKQPISFVVGKTNVKKADVPLEKVRTIEQNKTSSAQIKDMFGDPMYKTVDNNGIFWTYEGNGTTLSLRIDRNSGIVNNFTFTGVTNSKTEKIDYEKAKELKENETTFTQLVDFFGKPSQVNISNNEESWFYDSKGSLLSVMSTNRKSGVINFFSYKDNAL